MAFQLVSSSHESSNSNHEIIDLVLTSGVDQFGRKYFFEGTKGNEHLVRVEYPNGRKHFFEGTKGNEHCVRVETSEGDKFFFEGPKGYERQFRK